MTDMTVLPTAEFRQFAQAFHQDVLLQSTTLDGLVRTVLQAIREDDKDRLASYLEGLSNSHLPDRELLDAWHRCGSDLNFTDPKGVRELFREAVRQMRGA